MAIWSVLVLAGDEALGGFAALDQLVDAMEAQAGHLGFSVAGGAQPSVFLSLEGPNVIQARRQAESMVEAALASINRTGSVRATQVYDVEGRMTFDATAPHS